MPTLQIADKPTLDSINNKIDNITSSLSAITEKVNNSSGSVKSIQRGVITMSGISSSASKTATINAVNTSKAVVLYGGFTDPGVNSSGFTGSVRLTLTNGTTVTANYNGVADSAVVPFQVVEYN